MKRLLVILAATAISVIVMASGFSQTPFGAGSHDAAPALPDPVSIVDLGAVPDDSTDDTQPIQRALDGGRRIFVPEGRYLVSALVLRRDGITFYGKGMLQKEPGANGILLRVTGQNNVIRGLTLGSRAPHTILGSENDTLRIEGDSNLVTAIRIVGSNGNGIRINGAARNRIIGNTISDAQQNSIIVSNAGADNNEIADNRLVGTTGQNNIFITADDGSRANQVRIHGNVVRGNICVDAFDTGIESGQNADGTLIVGNHVSGSRNPAILLRDGRNVRIRENIIEPSDTAGRAADHTGIAVVPLFAAADWRYDAVIENNRIDLPIVRSGIYVGGSGVTVTGNQIIGRTPASGYGITIAGQASWLTIRGNTIRSVERGIDLNFDGNRYERTGLSITGNRVADASVGINRFNITARQSRIEVPTEHKRRRERTGERAVVCLPRRC